MSRELLDALPEVVDALSHELERLRDTGQGHRRRATRLAVRHEVASFVIDRHLSADCPVWKGWLDWPHNQRYQKRFARRYAAQFSAWAVERGRLLLLPPDPPPPVDFASLEWDQT